MTNSPTNSIPNTTSRVNHFTGLARRRRKFSLLPANGDGSTLTLDFTTDQLDPRLTFTRASDATFINSSGLVQYADANWVRNSTMLVSTGWTPNVVNGGTATINGDGSVTFASTAGRVTWLQTLGLAIGLQVTLSIEVTALTAGDIRVSDLFQAGFGFGSQIYHHTSPSGVTQNNISPTAGIGTFGVGLYSVTATTTGTVNNIIFGTDCNGVNRTGSVTIRNPQFQHGTVVPRRVYVPNSSTSSAKWDSPRFDYDPTTRAPKGLLIEGSATNMCLNGSMAYTATAPTSWARGFSGCTVASVDSTTFSGKKAWSVSATASGQRDLLEQVISLAANTTYTVSVYLEAVTGTTATFAYMTSLPAGATSGTVVDPSAGRVSFTVTVGATAGSGTLRIGIGSATGTGVSADASVRFSHVQVEAGSGASSYIPTGASQGNRIEDSATMSSVASLGFDQYQGTFIVRGVQNKQGAFFARLLRIAGATTEPFGMPVNGVTLYGTSRNALNTSIGEATRTNTLGQAFAFGMSLDANDAASAMRVSLNGSGTSAARTALGPTEAAASFSFNTNATATNYGCFAVRSVKFFPVTKTLAELNALTT